MVVEGQLPRFYVSDGRVYLIRDVREGSGPITCEYATLSEWTNLKWTPCPQGALFADIEPLGEVRP